MTTKQIQTLRNNIVTLRTRIEEMQANGVAAVKVMHLEDRLCGQEKKLDELLAN